MNVSRARRCLVSAALLGAALNASTCGGKVVLDGELYEGGNGVGGSGSGGSSSSNASQSSSGSSSGSGSICAETVCSGLGSQNCSCKRLCGDSKLVVNCAPNENDKLQCICSYDEVFSGACFETSAAVCDIDKGCCAKYFQGL